MYNVFAYVRSSQLRSACAMNSGPFKTNSMGLTADSASIVVTLTNASASAEFFDGIGS
jgi:hypothetical protein